METQPLLDFLDITQPFEYGKIQRYSSIVLALKDCRTATKRDILTGKLDYGCPLGDPGNWLGAIGYFSVLDLIGSTFKNNGQGNKVKNKNSIEYAIESFGYDLLNNNPDELEAIVGLRNAFAHNFNLLNVNPNNNNKRHRFEVRWDDNKSVVSLPKEKWDGIFATKDFSKINDITKINLFGFGNLVEEIYARIIDGVRKTNITIQEDLQTVLNKYSIIIFQQTQ